MVEKAKDIAEIKISLWKVIVFYMIITGGCISYFYNANAGQNKKIDLKVGKEKFNEHRLSQEKKDDKDDEKIEDLLKALNKNNVELASLTATIKLLIK